MESRTRPTSLSVERELLGPSGVVEHVRMTMWLTAEGGPEPTPEQLRELLTKLRARLDTAIGAPPGAEGPRSLEELVETYRPRQAELVELLRADGEISEAEAALLRAHLAGVPPILPAPAPVPLPAAVAEPAPSPADRPLAAMPLANDRTPSVPRPIPDLLAEYRIENLKQAGAVRARRQISYEEYMALKRHFAALESGGAAAAPGPGAA